MNLPIQGVSEGVEFHHGFSESQAKLLHPLFAIFPRQNRRPDPSDGERRLPPPIRPSSLPILNDNADACTNDLAKNLCSEFQRDASAHREEIESSFAHPDVGGFGHE